MKDLPVHKKIFLGIILLTALASLAQTALRLADIYPKKKPAAFNFAGKKFNGFEKVLEHEKYAGYYTDMPSGHDRTTLELLQAQHELVPVILDPDSLKHRFIIVNCIDIPAAIRKFKDLGTLPVARNNFGIFIVERPELRP